LETLAPDKDKIEWAVVAAVDLDPMLANAMSTIDFDSIQIVRF
jgi:hypothetical protein